MSINIYNYKDWGSRIFEQSDNTKDSAVSNITILDSFRTLKADVPTIARGSASGYVYMSAGPGQPIDDGKENNYLAFKNGQGVLVRHGNYVAIIAGNAGVLSRKNEVWTSPGVTGIMILSVSAASSSTVKDGTGPAVQYNPSVPKILNYPLESDANKVGAMILKAIGGSTQIISKGDKLFTAKGVEVGNTANLLEMTNSVINMMNDAEISIQGEVDSKILLTYAARA